MAENIMQDHLSGLWYRPESNDINTIRRVVDYKDLEIGMKDVVLDIGGHLGAFTDFAIRSQALRVVTFEPAPSSFKLLTKNTYAARTGDRNRVQIHNAALVAHFEETTAFYLNKGMNHGLHSSVERRGREVIVVKAQNFASVMKELKPTVVKMDCEGAEYELLPLLWDAMLTKQSPDLKRLKSIAIEWHFGKKEWKEKAAVLHTALVQAEFAAVKRPVFTGKAWASVGVYRRKV